MKSIKRLLALLVLLIILSSTLCIDASASSTYAFSISDDWETVYLAGERYDRIDGTMLLDTTYYFLILDLKLTVNQRKEIEHIFVTSDIDTNILRTEICKKSGEVIISYYLHPSCMEDYQSIISEGNRTLEVQDYTYYDNSFEINESDFYKTIKDGEKTVLKSDELEQCESYTIVKKGENLTGIVGFLILHKGEYYYASEASGMSFLNASDPTEFSSLTLFKISEGENYEIITNQFEGDGSDDDFEDSFLNFLMSSSIIFLSLLCFLIPLAIFIVCLIFSFKSKNIYKKILITISALALSEIIMFAITLISIFFLS